MSESTIIVIAIIAAVFLALLMVVTTSRRRDTERATGRLSRETIQKDRSEEAASEVLVGAGEQRSTGREIERLARTDAERPRARPGVRGAHPPPCPRGGGAASDAAADGSRDAGCHAAPVPQPGHRLRL